MKAILRLKGKIRPEKQRSAISYEQSVLPYQLPAKYPALNKAYYLRPFLLLILVFVSCGAALAQEPVGHTAPAAKAESISGMVVSAETGEPLVGATVRIKDTNLATSTNERGQFIIFRDSLAGVIEVSFLGYITKEAAFIATTHSMVITLEVNQGMIKEVMISTGYQEMSKERVTGSFVQIDNELLNRSGSTDIISRLKGIAPSLAFDERAGDESKLSIRGRSTIFANDQPLIVLDNFPYEGDINNINPNDIENISILRDAAAASIWGVRAGNGVIVITTKKGRNNRPLQINFNANTTIGQKPDLFYEPKMAAADYIEVERYLFDKGYYDRLLNDTRGFPAISPVVELLDSFKNGYLNQSQAEKQLAYYSTLDVRNDLLQYFYRPTLNQQYSLTFSGGSQNQDYFISVGFDKINGNLIGVTDQRLTTSIRQAFNPLENLTLNYNLSYNQSIASQEGSIALSSIAKYPYNTIYDRNGEEQPLVRDFRLSFAQAAAEKGLLDWTYYPIKELDVYDNRRLRNSLRFSPGIEYQFIPGLTARMLYQYEKQFTNVRRLSSEDAYSTRHEINQFTEFTDDGLNYYFPLGAILNFESNELVSHNGRAQVNYGYKDLDHAVSAVAGLEIRQTDADGRTNAYLGYDIYSGTSKSVSYDVYYPKYPSGSRSTIFNNERISGTLDRFRSYYVNTLYEYQRRWAISASARVDQTNLFGVKANQRSVPLWSTGFKWNLSNEAFYNISWLPYLNARFTYGYSGNFDKNVTAFLTASYSRDLISGERAALLGGLPNPRLRGERIAMYNYAVEFGTIHNRLHGKIEYYRKKGTDLIGSIPIDPTTGKTSFRGNVANMKGSGWDVEFSSKNTVNAFKWTTDLMLSTVQDEVTKYENLPSSISSYFNDGSLLGVGSIVPILGRPLFGVYSYPWAGLNSNGDPQGYLNDQPSVNYNGITNAYKVDNLIFHGRATPKLTGAIRNTFVYRSFAFSFNVLAKTGYYFRRPSINYSALFSSGLGHVDYVNRWKSSGDENQTFVPAMVYPAISARETFYANSEVLVEKGDHIRLQDLRIDYDLLAILGSVPKLKTLKVYAYANDLGIIWRANKQKLDPDYSVSRLVQTGSIVFPKSKSIAIGINIGL